jgi:hypothetical protein
MTILGSGDLAPRRRGRRRRTPYVAALLLVALAGAGGWFGWRAWHDRDTSSAQPAVVCVTPTPSAGPAPVKRVKVAVLNGTSTVGLAHTVAGTLTTRGFAIVKVGNGTASTGAPRITYAPGEVGLALTLAEQVPGATFYELSTQRPGQVELRISTGFRRLATLAEAKAAHARDLAATAPAPAACSTPRG